MADGSVVFETELDSSGLITGLGKLPSLSTVATAAAGAAIGAALGKAISSAVLNGMDFDSAVSQVAATMGKTVDEISPLAEMSKQLGASTQFTATQAAEAFNYLALAGYDMETSMETIPTVLDLAAAGGIDLAYASDMVTDSMSALGLSTDQASVFADQMAKTASSANTSVSQLGTAILTVGGTARYLAGGTAEVTTVIGLLADNGIKAEKAGTQLRNVITSLIAPTDKARTSMSKLGLEVFDAEGNMRPMQEIFSDLNTSMADMTQGERAQVLGEVFNKEDLKGVEALLGTTQERWTSLMDTVLNSSEGASGTMAQTMIDNLEGDVTIFKSAAEGLALEFYNGFSDELRNLVQTGTSIISKLTEGMKAGDLSGAFTEILTTDIPTLAKDIGKQLGLAFSNADAMLMGGAELMAAIISGALGAIGGLVSGIWDGLVLGFKEKKGIPIAIQLSIEQAQTDLETLDRDIEALKEKHIADTVKINVDAQNAQLLIAELAALQNKEILTDADVERVKSITESLVLMYPELSKYLGSDGILALEAGQVSNLIEQYRQLALQKAATQYMDALSAEWGEAMRSVGSLEFDKEDLETRLSIVQQMTRAYEELAQASANESIREAFSNFSWGFSDVPDIATIESAMELVNQYVTLYGSTEGLSGAGIDIASLFGTDGKMLDAATIQSNADAIEALGRALDVTNQFANEQAGQGQIEQNSITAQIEEIVKELETYVPQLEEYAKEYEKQMQVFARTFGLNLEQTLPDTQEGPITAAMTADVEGAATAVSEGAAQVKTAAETVVSASGEAIAAQESATPITDAVTADIEGVQTALTGSVETVGVNAQAVGAAITDGITSGMEGAMSGAAESAETGAAGEGGGISEQLSALGESMAKGVADGITKNVAAMANAMKSNSKKSIDAVDLNEFNTLGRQISAGIAQGITSGGNEIAAALVAAIKTALKAAKAAAKINSPSRLFADEIGVWIPAGVAQGVESGTVQLRRAVDQMVMGSLPDLRGVGARLTDLFTSGWYGTRAARRAAMGEIRQEINFNVPVQTPDEFAQTVELFATYGLEADY